MKKITRNIIVLSLVLSTMFVYGCSGSGANASGNGDTLSSQESTINEQIDDKKAIDDSEAKNAEDKGTDDVSDTDKTEGAEDPGQADTVNETADDKQDEKENSMKELKLSDGITLPMGKVKKLNVPDSESIAFAANLGIGFNLGNTFDAYTDPTPSDEMSTETAWHGVRTTQQMIKDIHAYGFDTIRIPVSWHNHVDGEYNISKQWLDRVNEVVDWAMDEGMYVVINIHHDNDPKANALYPDKAHLEQSKKYVGRIWEQLSARFKDYDDHLIFEAMNEPRLVGTAHEWDFSTDYDDCREAIDCINELNQLFVDTVRAGGVNNTDRYLMCPGYAASLEGGTNAFFTLPKDIDGRESHVMLSIHAYTPYNFALEYPGVSDFNTGDKDRTWDLNELMNKLYMDYVCKGTPVVIGEFGCRDKNGNLQDRVNYSAYYVRMASSRSIPCIWWDNNFFSGNEELFGIYDRKNPENSNTDIITALMEYKKTAE